MQLFGNLLKQVKYKVWKAAYPAIGVLYAFDSPEWARPWISGPLKSLG
jgi:hypothetical protein